MPGWMNIIVDLHTHAIIGADGASVKNFAIKKRNASPTASRSVIHARIGKRAPADRTTPSAHPLIAR